MPEFGWSFMPGGESGGQGMRTDGTPPNPIQEAIKVMSLRLPKFYSQRSIAPAPLLQAFGGMGQPGARGDVTAQALAMLAGVPLRSSSAPAMPVPVAEQDRERVSMKMPQPTIGVGQGQPELRGPDYFGQPEETVPRLPVGGGPPPSPGPSAVQPANIYGDLLRELLMGEPRGRGRWL